MFEPKCLDEFPNLKAFMCRFEVMDAPYTFLLQKTLTGSLGPQGPHCGGSCPTPAFASRDPWLGTSRPFHLGKGPATVPQRGVGPGSCERHWLETGLRAVLVSEAWRAPPAGSGEDRGLHAVRPLLQDARQQQDGPVGLQENMLSRRLPPTASSAPSCPRGTCVLSALLCSINSP